MKIKLRGKDADFLNEMLDGKDFDIFVGRDADGKEVFTGDKVQDVQSGGDYLVNLSLDLNYLPFESNLKNFSRLEG